MNDSVSPNSAELLNRAFFRAPAAFGVCSLSEGRFCEANDALARLIGIERQDILGRTDLDLGFWADAANRQQLWRQLGEGGAARELECRLRTKSGEARTVVVSAERISDESEASVMLVFHDVTERTRRKSKLHHAQKMEALGQLAAGFAHDFNNILAIVQGYTGLLMAEPGMSQQANLALKEVSKATERAAHLTRQLLTLSRKQYLRLKPANLNETVQRLGTMLQRLLGEKTVLQFQLASEVPAVRTDGAMFEQLVANLGLNARDAMPNGGTLNLSTALVHIDAEYARIHLEAQAGDFVRLTFADTGCGMDQATLDRLFEPFFTTKQMGHGTGLGLATVYGIVKQHRGWIEVASQPGEGTTFKIYFPAETSSLEPEDEQAAPARTAEGFETILVVEDEASLSTLVRGILERYGYRVLSAATGAEALRVWDEHQGGIDLLLTDLVMPGGLSGAQLAEQLKIKRPGLKVIYTSGYSADLMSEGIGELVEGVNFLQKPYRHHRLAQTVRHCLDGDAHSPANIIPAVMG